MGNVEVFLGTKLLERSGNPRIHMVPGPLVRLEFGGVAGINSRNTVGLSLIALRRGIHPMPSFDPPGSIPKFVYVIRGVYLDTQDMGNCCNLTHSKVKIPSQCHTSKTGHT